jgi:AraC-like DNA-binding protein
MFKYFVDFFGKAAKSFMDDLGLQVGEVRRVAEPDSVRFLFDELIHEGQKTTPRRHDAADAYLRLLLHKAAEIPGTVGAVPSAAYATWQRCRSILDERFREIKGLSELSRATRVDPSHLCRIFRRFGAGTPHAELTRRKLNHAAMLLLTTSDLVKAVALQVGFEDPLHFSRVFQRQFGCSPVAFREAEARRNTDTG